LFAVTSAVAFGTVSIIAKYAYEAGADALPLLAVRFTIAAALVYLILRATGRYVAFAMRTKIKLVLLGALGYGLEASLFFIALEHTTAAIVSLVFYSYPIWTTVIAIATRLERFRLALVAALALSTIGIVSIFSLPQGDMTGPLLALGASLVVGVYFVATQVVVKGIDPSTSALWTLVGAALALGIAWPIAGQSFPIEALGAAVSLSVVTAIAFVLMYAGVARIGSSKFAVAATMEPVTTVILAALLLDEPVTWRVVLGAALIISALPILATTAHRDQKLPAADSL
jgi:drug/metabolite transporter (DMT)-like permease